MPAAFAGAICAQAGLRTTHLLQKSLHHLPIVLLDRNGAIQDEAMT